MNKNKTLKKV